MLLQCCHQEARVSDDDVSCDEGKEPSDNHHCHSKSASGPSSSDSDPSLATGSQRLTASTREHESVVEPADAVLQSESQPPGDVPSSTKSHPPSSSSSSSAVNSAGLVDVSTQPAADDTASASPVTETTDRDGDDNDTHVSSDANASPTDAADRSVLLSLTLAYSTHPNKPVCCLCLTAPLFHLRQYTISP